MTDTMLFGILKMPFQMAMSDEMSRTQYYARVQELVGRFEAQQQAEPVADGDKVICPACCHQFRGIPETVQTLMLHAGFEPPFTTPPQQQAEPTCPDCKAAVLYECVACSSNNYPPKQQQAEPVQERITHITWDGRGVRTVNGIPDDAPRCKELSASEILDMMPSAIPAEYDGPLMEFARDLEAKLKEKNNG